NLEVWVVHKPIKNLHLAVLPPDGRIRVSSPLHLKDDAIRSLIATRIPWIRRQREKFAAQARQTPREYISGESHYVLGKAQRLEVVSDERPPSVKLNGRRKIVLQVRPSSTVAKREEVLTDWYRNELRVISTRLLDTWQERIGVAVGSWGIKR